MFTYKGKSKRSLRRQILKETQEECIFLNEQSQQEFNSQQSIISTDSDSNVNTSSNTDNNIDASKKIENVRERIVPASVSHISKQSELLAEGCAFSSIQHSCNIRSAGLSQVLRNDLRKWAIDCNIPHSHINKLLNNVLKKNFSDLKLPADARTLLKTTRKHSIIKKNQSKHFNYFGIQQSLIFLLQKHNFEITSNDKIELAINIDGVPLSKSTDSVFWPLLGSVTSISSLNAEILLLGLYHGRQKPEHPDILLQDFVKECQTLNGKICIQGVYVPFSVRMMICDMPAKSFVLQIKSPTGFFSCTKCFIKGQSSKPIFFVGEEFEKRTDGSFRSRLQPKHHLGVSVIEQLPSFDLIESVPLDYMHLVCLGVMKRMLAHQKYGFVFGKPPYKLRSRDIQRLNIRLQRFSSFIPIEFSRRTRKITDCKRYKASEFRTFLLYVGPVVFKNILSKFQYHNFLVLSVAISVLIDVRAYDEKWLKYAEELINCFISGCKELYGFNFFSLNIHSLMHLVDCCRRFGPLDKFSAFPFENFLQSLIKSVRKAHQPLQQVINRLKEQQHLIQDFPFSCYNKSQNKVPIMQQSHSEGPLLDNCIEPQYKKAILTNYTLSCNTLANRVVELIGGDIFEIVNFCHNRSKDLVIIGRRFKKLNSLFEKPCDSSQLSIFLVQVREGSLISLSIKSVFRKLVILPYNESTDIFATFPLLHC